jgi:hypothetical protein
MAFLSTLLSVFVEGLHKAFGMRRAGLEEMLRALHARVLTRLDPTTAQLDTSEFLTDSDARSGNVFARRMTENVSFRGRGWFGWMRAIPILREFVERRHERLSTLQFVEQLARTDVAPSLRAMSRPQRQRALTAAAYEFERFGDSQSSYFQSRARVMSVVFALIFAFAANIDALEVYKRLRTDAAVREYFARTDVSELERSLAQAEAAQSADARAVRQTLANGLVNLQNQGVPIGYSAFPWCRTAPPSAAAAPGEVAPAPPLRDARCQGEGSPSLSAVDALRRATTSSAGWLWFLSVLLAGGLIGLGAPFWYQLFRRLARMVPAAQSVRAVMQPDAAPTPSPSSHREAVRDANAATPNALLLAFDVASGAVADSVTGADGTQTMIVRGDGSLAAQAPAIRRHLR